MSSLGILQFDFSLSSRTLEGKEAFVNLAMTSSHLWPVGQPIGLFAKMLQYGSASQLDNIADKHGVTCPAKNAATHLAQIF